MYEKKKPFGLIFVLALFIGFMVLVTGSAYLRRSGRIDLDVVKIPFLRLAKEENDKRQ